MPIKLIIMLSAVLVLSAPAMAQEDAAETYTDVGAPASAQAAAPSGLHGIIGAALFNSQRIIGDDGRRTALLPLVLMRYEDWAYWSLTGGGVWLAQTEDHSLRFGAGVRIHGGWRPDDDPNLQGMETRRSSLDGYLNAVWRTAPVTVGVHYYHDVLDANRGDAASLRLSRRFKAGKYLSLTPSIGVEWQNSRRVNYYYGVRPEEALPGRPAYTGTETVNTNAGLAAGYRLTESWLLSAGAFLTRYGSGITDSPIVVKRSSTTVYAGAGWRF